MKVSHRRTRSYMSALGVTQMRLRNPWVAAFFAFSYPGFGNLLQERYLKAFILIGWEVFINTKAHINLGIMYSLLGQFDKAKAELDQHWLILYCGIYIYSIWDSYRGSVDLNKQYLLADRENAPVLAFKFSSWDINFLDKREPWTAVSWSILTPGLGHLYLHKVIAGFFIFASTIVLMHFSHTPMAIHYTMVGDFANARKVLNMQWALYLPSVYTFFLYDAYSSAVELNSLFEKEQKVYLRDRYQNPAFKMPV